MKILLGVTGSVATVLLRKMVRKIKANGFEVEVAATTPSLYFFKADEIEAKVWKDDDEWPGEIYEKEKPVRHIELREWADMLLVAPLSANTLGKMANGLADNLLTSVIRAWDPQKPIVVAPAMNTKMWEHPITAEKLETLKRWYNLTVVFPQSKRLACNDEGIGALADIDKIVKALVDARNRNYSNQTEKEFLAENLIGLA